MIHFSENTHFISRGYTAYREVPRQNVTEWLKAAKDPEKEVYDTESFARTSPFTINWLDSENC